MTKTKTGKWVGAAQNRWPIGRGVAIYMRPETAARHLDAGVRLGDRLIAVGTGIRKLLHDLFAPLDIDAIERKSYGEPAAPAPSDYQDRKAA